MQIQMPARMRIRAQRPVLVQLRSFIVALMLLSAAGLSFAQDQVVYHFDNAATQALRGLRSLRNHLDTDPTARIVAVAHGDGVDMLMEGAKAANGTEYASLISALRGRGVSFEVCEITLRNRNLKKDDFVQEADFTPSGVVRIAKLQKQGYAYIKP